MIEQTAIPVHRRLAAWLKMQGIRQGEFASQIGVTGSTVSLWLNGRQRPSGDARLLIEYATSGAVPVEAWGIE